MYLLVELRGVEPLSKNCPTFRRLQFSLLLGKTAHMRADYPCTEFACKIVGIRSQAELHRIHLDYAVSDK